MNGYTIIEGKQVTADDIEQARQLDRLVYDEEYFVSLQQCLQWYGRNRQIYTMLRDNQSGNIIAYVNLSPVTAEYYEKIRSGNFVDTFLPAEAIVDYDLPDIYDLYFSSIVVHPDYQNLGLLLTLFNAIAKKFLNLGKEGILIRRMVADAVSERGVKFCKLFGMTCLKGSSHDSQIYEAELLPPNFRVSSKPTRELYSFYQEKAVELGMYSTQTTAETPDIESTPYMDTDSRGKVFISYSSKDADVAKRVCEFLEENGMPCWIAPRNVDPGANYPAQIVQSIRSCSAMVLLASENTNRSGHVSNEVNLAFSNKKLIIPFRLEKIVFSDEYLYYLNRKHRIDAYQDMAQGLDLLLHTLKQNMVSSDLSLPIQSPQPVPKNQSPSEDASPVDLDAIHHISRKYFKRSFSSLADNRSREMLEKNTADYSSMFSVISCVKHGSTTVDFDEDLIDFLVQAICGTHEENAVKIIGNSGTDKNALTQLIYLNLYAQANRTGDIIPFYINLAFYEKQTYDTSEKIATQLEKELSQDLKPFLDYCRTNPKSHPIILIDGLRDYVFSKTLIEHVLAEKLSRLPNLVKVVSVDTNLIGNKRRQKKVIALAPSSFEYTVQITPVDLVDEEQCFRFYEAFGRIHGTDVSILHEKMKQMSFYEIDPYILRLSSAILLDNLYNSAFTISDLYEAMCLEMFNGNRELLLQAAKTAYEFAYSDNDFNDVDVFSARHWTVIKRHKSIVEFLISYYYVYKLTEFEDDWDIPFFEQVLPKEITRFITPRLNDSFLNEEKVIKLCKAHYDKMGVLGKSEMTFWLGRLKSSRLALESTTLLRSYYDQIKTTLLEKEENKLYFDLTERKADLFLMRGILVSLIYKGIDSMAVEYITLMLNDDLPNIINRGFHLEYYGDKPYIPNKDVLDFDDDVRVGERTLKRLVKNITQHLSLNRSVVTPVLELDLFTMCSLIQNRIGGDKVTTLFDIYPYVEQCVSFLNSYSERIRHVSDTQVNAYFGMIRIDFTRFLEQRRPLAVQSEVLNRYGAVRQVKRTGWVDLGIPDPESIAEHMYAAWLMGMLNLPESYPVDGYDKNAILSMLMIHDLGETVTGDIPRPKKIGHPEYDQDEDLVMRQFLLRGTYPGVTNLRYYYNLWDEWYEQRTINALVAKDLDRLQAMYQLCCYYIAQPEQFSDERVIGWLRESAEIQTEIGIILFEKLIKNNSDFASIFRHFPQL